MIKVYKLVQKGKEFLNTCKFSQQADKHQHQDLGGGGGREYAIIFWAGVSSVTQEPFTSPCSAAMLPPWLFGRMCS